MRALLWQPDAWEEYLSFQQDKVLLKRINKLIKDIQRNGYQCSYGKPEMLVGDLKGCASVRIDRKHRLVFHVSDTEVVVLACGSHYGDK